MCGRDRRGGGGGGADRQKFTHRRQTGHLRWSAQPAARLDISFSSRKTSGVLILERPRAVRRDKYVLSDGLKFPLFLQSDSFTPPVFQSPFVFLPPILSSPDDSLWVRDVLMAACHS